MDHPSRAGRFVQQNTGYKAFIPAPLPPDPPLTYSGELQSLLSDADRNIGLLDALASMLPNPDLFVAMYVRHEAVLSSQIEGTQSTLEDVLAVALAGLGSCIALLNLLLQQAEAKSKLEKVTSSFIKVCFEALLLLVFFSDSTFV